MDLVAAFSQQAGACEALGSPMYAGLLTRLVADLEAGGPTRDVLAGHEDDPGPSALALRLLGSVHRLVLERRAGALAAYYPSVGGTWDDEAGSAAFLHALEEQPDEVREWLDRPPQTNEVGRSAALMGGLLQLPDRRPVRLFEIGSSGGLNLLADHYRFVDDTGTPFNAPSGCVLDLAWQGRSLEPWDDLRVVERTGCDLLPIDVTTTAGRLALTAYVWPDQTARFERLRGAMAVAQQHPPVVHATGAGDFVEQMTLRDGAWTVLWHSIMWQYLPAEEQSRITARVEALGHAADASSPFAHLFLEPTRRGPGQRHELLVVLTTWPGGVRRVLGKAPAHGLPVTWE
jgi:hypothetical protein